MFFSEILLIKVNALFTSLNVESENRNTVKNAILMEVSPEIVDMREYLTKEKYVALTKKLRRISVLESPT